MTIKIKPNSENFDGEAKFAVNNDYDGKLSNEDKNSWKAKRKLSPAAIGLITTLSIFSIIGTLIPLIILIYRKRTTKTK